MPIADLRIPLRQSNQLDSARGYSATTNSSNSATVQPIRQEYSPLYIVAAYARGQVRTWRTQNPARAMTICKKFVKDGYPVNIQIWCQVGNDYMIPFNYNATSTRDLEKCFSEMTKDILCAENVLKNDAKGDEDNGTNSVQYG